MHSDLFGFKINLIYCAILVAAWDICHIVIELFDRFDDLRHFENTQFGCLKDYAQAHCVAVSNKFIVF
jgi:hypothetical protein